MIGHGKGLFTMRNGYRGRMRTISRRHAASQTTAQSEMTAQSKLSDGDGDKDKFKESGKSKFEFGLLFDPTQMVLPALCLAPVLYFNNSQRGKSWYADTFKAFAGNNEGLAKYLWFGVTKAVAVPAFIGTVAFCTFIDFTGKPSWIYETRLQPEKQPPKPLYFIKILLWNLLYQRIIIGPVGSFLSWKIWTWRGEPGRVKQIPTILQSIWEFVLSRFVAEFLLYITHRILHFPFMYRHFHKWHHTHTSPFTITNFYAHPVEHLFQNVVTSMAAPVCGIHPSTMWAQTAYGNIDTFTHHSGYNIPFTSNASFHDWHHRVFEGNYGIYSGLITWDYLFGTCDPYLRWLAKYRRTHGLVSHQKLATDADEVCEVVETFEQM